MAGGLHLVGGWWLNRLPARHTGDPGIGVCNRRKPGPGDSLRRSGSRSPGVDQIAVEYGLGRSHKGEDQVERLLALRIDEGGMVLAGKPPIYLQLSSAVSRNWEGVVRYGEGFLLVTDEYPTTILAFLEKPRGD